MPVSVPETSTPAAVHPWTSLLLEAQAGKRETFAKLVELAEKPIFGFVHRKVRDRQLTEDVVAETFLKAWRTLATYDPKRCQGSTWLFLIARRLVIDQLRKKGRRHETSLDGSQDEAGNLVDQRANATQRRTEDEHLAAVVRKALEDLPARYAEAIDLMYLQGLDRH